MPLPYSSVLGFLTEGLLGPTPDSGLGGVGPDCGGVPAATRLWWAIDIELAGVVRHFATSAVEVDGVAYQDGLSPLDLSRIVDFSATIEFTISTVEDWPAIFAAVRWLIDGRPATLWLVVREGGVRRRVKWVEGTTGITSWGRRGEPLSVTLRNSSRTYSILNERARVDPYTQPDANPDLPMPSMPYEVYAAHQGQYYPLLIGYPGYDGASDKVYAVVPIPVVQSSWVFLGGSAGDPGPPLVLPEPDVYLVENGVCCVAVGRIEASKAWIIELGVRNPVSGTPIDPPVTDVSVSVGLDRQEQPYTYFVQEAGSRVYEGNAWETYVGLSPQYGGGLMWRGALLRGGADIFAWMVSEYTSHQLDEGRHRAHASRLNAYKFDLYINQPLPATDWFSQEVLAFLPARIVQGDEGIFLAHMPTHDSQSNVVASLSTETGAAFERLDSSTDEIVNELTIRWAPSRDVNAYFESRVVTALYHRPRPVPGSEALYADERAYPTALARRSQESFGVRPSSLEVPSVWDATTAYQIAEDYVSARAFPTRRLTYSLPVSYYQLMPGDVVDLTDPTQRIEGQRCMVEDVRITPARVRVVLRPLRNPDLYL